MRYRCVRKCFWNSALFEVGEVFEAEDGAAVPEHFVKEEGENTRQEGEKPKAKVKGKK